VAVPFGVDIDSLCADLEVVLKPSPGSGGDPASAEDTPPVDPVTGEPIPKWTPLVFLKPPGLDTIVATIKPPIQIIQALLQVISAFLKVLSAILIGLLDPYRALILAAYQLLKDLFNDLLNAGGYLYADIPGVTSPASIAAEMGLPHDTPAQIWKHGKTGGPPPPVPIDGLDKWAHRFGESFDDPGDPNRPIFSDGATLGAVFVAFGAPSLAPFMQLIYLLGKLLNLQSFIDAFNHYKDTLNSPDPHKSQARLDPIAPDWHSIRVKDILPPLKKILIVPELLRALLLKLDGLQSLLADMAQALLDKAAVLDDLVKTIQAILDFLDALTATGFYALPVFTTEGVEGLKKKFIAAQDRPPTGYFGAVCFLAGGPGIGDMTVIYDLLTSPSARDAALDYMEAAAEKTAETAENAWKDQGVENAWNNAEATAEQAVKDIKKAARNAGKDIVSDLTSPARAAEKIADGGPIQAIDDIESELEGETSDAVKKARGWIAQSKTKAARSLATSYAATQPLPPVDPDAGEKP